MFHEFLFILVSNVLNKSSMNFICLIEIKLYWSKYIFNVVNQLRNMLGSISNIGASILAYGSQK